jgi:hypothetical protein
MCIDQRGGCFRQLALDAMHRLIPRAMAFAVARMPTTFLLPIALR